MYHKQLVIHINSKRLLGLSDEDICNELIQDGWSKEDIDLGFYYLENPEKLNHFSLKRILKSEIKESTALLIIIFVIIISVTSFYYFRTTVVSYALVAPAVPVPDKIVFDYGVQPALSNHDFFDKVKNQFITESATFVEVDLTKMSARVYKNGEIALEVPVKTKGKPGSWWETPAGLYKIETKEKTHYSTMGHVTQPWSMEFQGNFFIHGWPYHDDGTPVATTFSGGCVRLADEDAKKIFNLVNVGTPILVYEKAFSPDNFSYSDTKPNIKAESFLFADINNNFVFLKKDETKILPAGNITKLMTALVATEYINIEKTTKVQKESLVKTSKPRLRVGMKIDIYQLLFPLLRESSNEAGETIARSYGRDLFIKHMNEKAKAIGMTHTIFVDPTGVSLENVSTPEDVFMLAKYIYNNRSFIFNITSGKVKTNTYGVSIFSDLDKNTMSDNQYFFGGIGENRSADNQYNLSVFELPVNSTIRPIFSLLLLSTDVNGDLANELGYLLNHYK